MTTLGSQVMTDFFINLVSYKQHGCKTAAQVGKILSARNGAVTTLRTSARMQMIGRRTTKTVKMVES